MTTQIFDKLLTFLNKLEQEKISYTLAHHRDEAIMINVAVPGSRWEVEFLSDGSIEVEKFISHGEIAGEEALSELFARYSQQEDIAVESLQNTDLATVRG
ncbi:hypothetical protein [Argonema antarcticum]|uniref:hypothetical protein n=1 Tax=Argonema antarcticum TaxID=2942763 RepID=UPI0020128255|nr:hypothetical protein [Argonema antarcticum]MCL1472331.1 hypothetical protein [Argonema antarcticum A004/B2]